MSFFLFSDLSLVGVGYINMGEYLFLFLHRIGNLTMVVALKKIYPSSNHYLPVDLYGGGGGLLELFLRNCINWIFKHLGRVEVLIQC